MEVTRTRKLGPGILLPLLIQLCVPFGSVSADTQYVSDMLILTLRDCPSKEYKAIRTLKTDTPVEVLEERGSYLKVRTKEGEEGWVARQYITSKTPKPLIIAGLKKEASRLKERIERLEKSRAYLQNDLGLAMQKVKEFEKSANKYRQEASQASLELKLVTEKYNTLRDQSGNVVELMVERDRLVDKNDQLNVEMKHLQQENARLMRTGMLWWFLAGASVLSVGFIAGKTSMRKKVFY